MKALRTLTICVLALLPLSLALARSDEPQNAEPRERPTLDDSVKRVERDTGGRVLQAESIQRDGREVHRVKVMTDDGRVQVMRRDSRRPERREAAPEPEPRSDRDD